MYREGNEVVYFFAKWKVIMQVIRWSQKQSREGDTKEAKRQTFIKVQINKLGKILRNLLQDYNYKGGEVKW